MSIHDTATEVVEVANQQTGSQVPVNKPGVDMCRILNFNMMRTYIRYYLDIGGRYCKCLNFIPCDRGDMMRVICEGHIEAVVPWDTNFIMKPGTTVLEFISGYRHR